MYGEELHDLELFSSAWRLNVDLISLDLAHQGTADRGGRRDESFRHVRFLAHDKLVYDFLFLVQVEERHFGTEGNPALRDFVEIHHGKLGKSLFELAHPRVDETLPLFGGVVLRVLGQIPVLSGDFERSRKLDVELLLESFDLCLEFLENVLCHSVSEIITGRKGFRKIIVRTIESTSNSLVKTVRRLARARKRESRFLVEGMKLVRAAIECGATLEHLVFAHFLPAELRTSFGNLGLDVVEVEDRVFRHMSSMDSPDGLLAVARRPEFSWDDVGRRMVVVCVGIQDPGNLGAIARIAEATGASGLVVTHGSADPFGPKALRGSMGSALRLCILDGLGEEETVAELRGRGFRLAATVPQGGIDFRRAELGKPLALLLGREGPGLPTTLLERCEVKLSIPMSGAVESLNVATVAAIVLYEAARSGD